MGFISVVLLLPMLIAEAAEAAIATLRAFNRSRGGSYLL